MTICRQALAEHTKRFFAERYETQVQREEVVAGRRFGVKESQRMGGSAVPPPSLSSLARPSAGAPPLSAQSLKPDGERALQADETVTDVVNKQAVRIVEALGDEKEVKERTSAAIAAVKKRFPLLHPPEPQLLLMLERAVITLRDKNFSERQYDDSTGRTIDLSKIKSRGDIG